MQDIQINNEEFNSIYDGNKNLLVEIAGSLPRDPIGSIGTCRSTVIESFRSSYSVFFNSVIKAVQLMSTDWNIAKCCVDNIQVFDRYCAAIVANCEPAARYASGACTLVMENADAYENDIGIELLPDEALSYTRFDDWVVTEAGVDRLCNIISSLQRLSQSCLCYQSSIIEFKASTCINGNVADAIKNYISEVHNSILEIIDNVGEELINAIRQYQVFYEANFPEGDYYFIRTEIKNGIVTLTNKIEVFDSIINDSRSTVIKANGTLNVPGILSYSGEQISEAYANGVVSKINNAVSVMNNIVEIVDENELVVETISNDVKNDAIRIRASLESITPMGGYRMLNYRPNTSDVLLSRSNIDDIDNIVVEDSNHISPIEYFIEEINNSENGNVSQIYDQFRNYLATRIPNDTEISDSIINNMINYYQSLLSDWSSEQAEDILIYAASYYRNQLRLGRYDLLDRFAVAHCPSPRVAPINAANWAMRIANDPTHGYNQDTRLGEIDYDCSSLVMSAYIAAGVPGIQRWSTYGMLENLCDYGFYIVGSSSNFDVGIEDLHPGDILLRESHTEIYVGNGYAVSASENERGEYHRSEYGDGLQQLAENTHIPNINNPETLDRQGEIRFVNVNDNGCLVSGWTVYRYGG